MIFMKIFLSIKNLFDSSGYPQDSKFFNPVSKKVIGKIIDELKGKILCEFVRIKSKIYSF